MKCLGRVSASNTSSARSISSKPNIHSPQIARIPRIWCIGSPNPVVGGVFGDLDGAHDAHARRHQVFYEVPHMGGGCQDVADADVRRNLEYQGEVPLPGGSSWRLDNSVEQIEGGEFDGGVSCHGSPPGSASRSTRAHRTG